MSHYDYLERLEAVPRRLKAHFELDGFSRKTYVIRIYCPANRNTIKRWLKVAGIKTVRPISLQWNSNRIYWCAEVPRES